MGKRISELMNDINDELLKEVSLEKPIEDKVMYDKEGVEEPSLERIKKLAMDGIIDEPKKAIKVPKLMKFKRHLLPLVAALILLGSTAIAIGSSDQIRSLFGDAFGLIQSDVQALQMTDKAGGVIFTAEEVIIDNRSALIIVSCEKEDGTPFESDINFFELIPSTEQRGGKGWGSQVYLSEDQTQLFAVINYSSEKKLDNQQMTLKGRYLGTRENYKALLSTDIYELYHESQQWETEEWEDYVENYNPSETLGTGILEVLPVVIDRVHYTDEGALEILTSYEGHPILDTMEMNFYLRNKGTGEIIESNGRSTSGGPYGTTYNARERFDNFPIEQLDSMELGVAIDYFDMVSEGEWEVNFKLDENKNILSYRPGVNITKGDLKVKIKELEISALGVTIEGTKNRALMQELDMQLLMKDGSKYALLSSSASSRYNYLFTQSYILDDILNEANEPITNPQSKPLREGVIEDSGIGESGFSISKQQSMLGDEMLSLPTLIDSDQVQGIFIEGTFIDLSK